jgi:hypothetical protein
MKNIEEKLKALSIADLLALWESDFIDVCYVQNKDTYRAAIQSEIYNRLDNLFTY